MTGSLTIEHVSGNDAAKVAWAEVRFEAFAEAAKRTARGSFELVVYSPHGEVGRTISVRIVDESTLWLPDWRGNNRLDSLRNIVEDGRLSLMFMVPGSNNVVRVNGTAELTTDETITARFEQKGKHPRTVIVVRVAEVYFQCAKALMRSRLWESGDESDSVPTAGDFIGELQAGFDARAYDEGYADYAKDRMW